jgi:hypothetical protein
MSEPEGEQRGWSSFLMMAGEISGSTASRHSGTSRALVGSLSITDSRHFSAPFEGESAELGMHGRQYVLAHFDRQVLARKLTDVMQHVVSNG